MRYNQIFILLLTFAHINCKVKAQNPVEVDIHLHQTDVSQSKFLFKYEFGGERENVVRSTVFEAILLVTLISSKNDTFYYQIESEAKKTSNIETSMDSKASTLYTTFGVSMKLTCDQNGKLIDIINKDELMAELTRIENDNNSTGFKHWLKEAREENETLIFESIYRINYETLLKYTQMNKRVPLKMESDSLIEKTLETPEAFSKTTEENIPTDKFYEFRKFTEVNSKELLQKEELYETLMKPSKTTVTEIAITDKNGMLKDLTLDSKTNFEGIVIKHNGKIFNEAEPFTEMLTVEYKRM